MYNFNKDLAAISTNLYNDVSTFIYSLEGNLDLIKRTPLEAPLLRLIDNVEKYAEARDELNNSVSYEDIVKSLKNLVSES